MSQKRLRPVALVLCSAIALAAVTAIPFVKISERHAAYATVSRGATLEDVVSVMGKPDSVSDQPMQAGTRWGQELQANIEDDEVKRSLRYTTSTFFLPVTFEFTFDENGQILGKHRYD